MNTFPESWAQLLGRLLGYENVSSIEQVRFLFAAPWARDGLGWILLGCAVTIAFPLWFYWSYQQKGSRISRIWLGGSRAALLTLLFLILAEPTWQLVFVSHPRPLLWLLFDGSDSMNLVDELSDADRKALADATGVANWPKSPGPTPTPVPGSSANVPASSRATDETLSRIDYLKHLLEKQDKNLLHQLQEKFRLRAFVFAQREGVRALDLSGGAQDHVRPEEFVRQLTATGEVTALGSALEDLATRQGAGHLAGVVVFSDFDKNAGPEPWSAAERLAQSQIPIYTVGLGPATAVDLAVELRSELVMKKAERAELAIHLRQHGMDGQAVEVQLFARQIDTAPGAPTLSEKQLVDRKTLTLQGAETVIGLPYTPDKTGRFVFSAEVVPQEGEIVEQNNVAEREVSIRDDFLRLMFVEYEPTWEWRFIKEVFHRDKLVGIRGFRTFLRSADPKVRHSNELFLPTLAPSRGEFFANDVIFLGDMPSATLSTRFCEMTKEFVEKFGGGLVVISGPRFGPGQLASTPLVDLLPVIPNPELKLRDQKEFQLELAPEAAQVGFMQLGNNEADNRKGWANLGKIPWYQPVERVHPLGIALAVHPTDRCVDNETPQPLVAMRRYGRGTVVYLGFNETWRMRRKYGEQYYRQFWGQMIYALGLSHTLGSQKRFAVRTDRQQYQADDNVLVTVEAYDSDFQPITEDLLEKKTGGRQLRAEVVTPRGTSEFQVAQLREGVFEARLPVHDGGEHRIRVYDPETKGPVEVNFQVTSLSVERRSAVRNVALQERLSQETGGKAYDLTSVAQLPEDIHFAPRAETSVVVNPLWNTWLAYGVIVALMLGEWLVRKWVNLP